MMRLPSILLIVLALPALAAAQTSVVAPTDYTPITPTQRVQWVVKGNLGPRSLGIGVFTSAWNTAFNTPKEWGRSFEGFGRRYGEREAHIAMSNGIEAGLGSLWGEEPRYVRSGAAGGSARIGHALKSAVLSRRRDGSFTGAWARYAGNVTSSSIENAWMPPSATTAKGTTLRITNGFLGRMVGNVWEEFWPDIRQRMSR